MKPSKPTSTKGTRRKPTSATEQAKPDLMQQSSPQPGPPQPPSKPESKQPDDLSKKAADFRRWAESEPNQDERNRLLSMATLGEQLSAMRSRTSSGEPSQQS